MLTKTACDKFEPKSKNYKKFDSQGLYLEISPNGKKNWRLKYKFFGKEKRISLGQYPLITLVKAREKRDDALKLLDSGIDPSLQRKKDREEARYAHNNTFEAIAREWHAKNVERWSKSRARVIDQTLVKNIYPFIGSMPISEIEIVTLLHVLQRIEDRGSYYVTNRTNQLCARVFKYAIQTGRCQSNPARELVGAFKTKKTTHYPSIEAHEISELLTALQYSKALSLRVKNAILFSLLTFCRPGEIRQARWQDINLIEKIWLIPAEFMKLRKAHYVPLSNQAVQILKSQLEDTKKMNTPWVFPARTSIKKPMSDGTVNISLKKLGFHKRLTAHGFRALARTAIREKLKYYPDVIEAQLAHRPLGALGAAYDRAQFIDERVQMMQDWADFIDRVSI